MGVFQGKCSLPIILSGDNIMMILRTPYCSATVTTTGLARPHPPRLDQQLVVLRVLIREFYSLDRRPVRKAVPVRVHPANPAVAALTAQVGAFQIAEAVVLRTHVPTQPGNQ